MASEFEVEGVAVRDADVDADDGRSIEGVLMTYGEPVRGRTREYGDAVETFAPGAFREAIDAVSRGERIPVIDQHYGETVGYADRLWERDGKLHFAGRLFSMQAARDFAERVAGKVLRVSAEFMAGEIKRGHGTVTHTRVRMLAGIAGSYAPAYAGTSVSVRHMEGQGVTDQTDTQELPAEPAVTAGKVETVSREDMARIATGITQEALRQFAARSALGEGGPVDLFADFRGKSIGELAKRAMEDTTARDENGRRASAAWPLLAARALADTVTTSGANAGMVTPGVIGDVHGIVSRGRPAITAFGGPRPLSEAGGMSVDWPYYDGTLTDLVGAQSAQKAAITSAAIDIKKGTEALATYAGGSDIAYQLLRRATRPYLDAYFRILLTAWGVVTDAAFVTELESGSVTSDFAEALSAVDATEFKNLLIDASVAVETATGLPAEFALASTTAFKQFAKLFTPIVSMPSIQNSGLGGIDISTLRVNIGNLPLIHVPSVTAGKIIVSNSLAAAWYEDGPFQAQAEDVEKLGQNVAIWSMGAGARFIPAGIIEMYDVTP